MADRPRHCDPATDKPSMTSGGGRAQTFGPDTRFSTIARAWLEQRRYKPTRTYAQYESRMKNHIIDPLGRMAIGNVTPAIVVSWIAGLRATGLSETTIGLVFSHLSGILEFAVEDDIIDRNPCRARPVREVKPKHRKKTTALVPITPAQSAAIRAQLPERYRATVDVARGLGLRQGEIFGLSPEGIAWTQRMVHVVRQISHDRGRTVFTALKCSNCDSAVENAARQAAHLHAHARHARAARAHQESLQRSLESGP